MSEVIFRDATSNDAEQIIQIYQPFIEHTTVTLATQVPTVEHYKIQIEKILNDLAFKVAQKDDQIIGYAFANHFQEKRQAYKYTCILSIYVDPSFHGTGISHKLYQEIEAHLIALGIVQLYSNVTSTNIAGLKFHEKMGYQIVGQMPRFGYKFDEWHDITWMAKTLKTNL